MLCINLEEKTNVSKLSHQELTYDWSILQLSETSEIVIKGYLNDALAVHNGKSSPDRLTCAFLSGKTYLN